MTRNNPHKFDRDAVDESQQHALSRFKDDTRGGAASQIDFVNGMILLLLGVLFFFGASTVMLATMSDAGPGDQMSSWRGAEKLTGDAFVESPANSTATQNCIDSFFNQNPDEDNCGQSSDWTTGSGGEQAYLRNALSLSDSDQVYVELRIDRSGGVTRELGGNPPIDDVGTYQRMIPVQDGSGGYDWATMTVYVW